MKAFMLLFAIFMSTVASAEEHGTGFIHTKDLDERQFSSYAHFTEIEMTKRYDLRLTPGGLPPIRDQKACGSCWAFATTGALEGTIAIREGRKVDLSEQEMVSCNQERYSCDGGSFIHEMQVSPGQTGETDFPYQARDVACRQGRTVREKAATFAYIGASNRAPTPYEIKQAIFQNGPVAVTVTSNSAMQNYRGGLFTGCDQGQTNHMVVLVGWNDVDKINGKTGYWIMRNSWGTAWGDKGYMYIPYGCSRIGEDASTVFLPVK